MNKVFGLLLLLCLLSVFAVLLFGSGNDVGQQHPTTSNDSPTSCVGATPLPLSYLQQQTAAIPRQTQRVPIRSKISDKHADELQQQLFSLNHPIDCSSAKFLIISMDRQHGGFGAQFNGLTNMLSWAYSTNRVFMMMDPDHWNYAPPKCSKGWNCWFVPTTNCTVEDVWEVYAGQNWSPVINENQQPKMDAQVILLHLWHHTFDFQGTVANYIPAQYAHRGMVWWRSQLTTYLFYPQVDIIDYVESAKKRMWWPSDPSATLIGMHIRHGDKKIETKEGGNSNAWIKSDRLYEAREYFDKLPELLAGRPIQGKPYVFVASDDPAVIAVARTYNQSYIILLDDTEERRNGEDFYKGGTGRLVMGQGQQLIKHQLDAFKNLWLLGSCQYFIGTFSSCYGKVAYQLIYTNNTALANTSHAGRAISLDQEWWSYIW